MVAAVGTRSKAMAAVSCSSRRVRAVRVEEAELRRRDDARMDEVMCILRMMILLIQNN